LYVFFYFVVKNDPFFGDAVSSVSRAAVEMYGSDFTKIGFPSGYDPGHPILIPGLYAIIWKLFGLGLAISHLLNFLFSIAIAFLCFHWMKRFYNEKLGLIAASLLALTPLFVSQTAMLNTHLPLCFFILLTAYGLKTENKMMIVLGSVLSVLTHLQALFYLASLVIWYFYRDGLSTKSFRKISLWMLPASIAFFLWVAFHFYTTGWAISSPDYADHRGMSSLKGILVNLILADWRIMDFGQIALVLLVLKGLLTHKFKRIPDEVIIFLACYGFNALAIAFTTTTGPAHRYFLPCLPFLIMGATVAFVELRTIWRICAVLVLISGHFWFYPGKIIGDATLHYRSGFQLMPEITELAGEDPVYSYAPLGNSVKHTYLMGNLNNFRSLYNVDFDTVPYVLYSNLSGDFSPEMLQNLRKGWHGKSLEEGQIYFDLFANPKLFPEKKGWELRKPSRYEKLMIEFKQKMRGN
jgi:hypothetical protein